MGFSINTWIGLISAGGGWTNLACPGCSADGLSGVGGFPVFSRFLVSLVAELMHGEVKNLLEAAAEGVAEDGEGARALSVK